MKQHGLEGAVEINSFHARYPDEFRAIIENFILSYYDEELKDELIEFNEEQSKKFEELISNNDEINSLLEQFLGKLKEEIENIHWDKEIDEYETEFNDLKWNHGTMDYSERDKHYNWLLDTKLSYEDQLIRYKRYWNYNFKRRRFKQ